ncbi:MAG: hypothetical protein BWY46_01976 [Firmicutes bacterium ADurb.Bin300]|nr:MAG: hypothetical protein BWY46_01976 [Firmicutes bacterium ADurb.Bin300]
MAVSAKKDGKTIADRKRNDGLNGAFRRHSRAVMVFRKVGKISFDYDGKVFQEHAPLKFTFKAVAIDA